MIPLTRDRDEEELQRSARRLFRRIFEVIYRPDGAFVVKDRRTGAVVGAGWRERRRWEDL